MQVIQNDVIKCCKMMSSNVVLLQSNNCCVVLEPAICEDLGLHVAIFYLLIYMASIYPEIKIVNSFASSASLYIYNVQTRVYSKSQW